MNRRERAKGKIHPRNDEGRVVNHAMCAMATQTMTSWTIAKTDASERAGKPAGKRACACMRAYVNVHMHLRVYRCMSRPRLDTREWKGNTESWTGSES